MMIVRLSLFNWFVLVLMLVIWLLFIIKGGLIMLFEVIDFVFGLFDDFVKVMYGVFCYI